MSTSIIPLSSSTLKLCKGMTLSAQVELYGGSDRRDIHMQQVGEEVEGIIMLSLLKQKMEALAESLLSPRSSPRLHRATSLSSESETDAADLGSPTLAKRKSGLAESPSKRQRASESSWMEMFIMVKRNNAATDKNLYKAKDGESSIMYEWLQRQSDLNIKGELSQERSELLRMLGYDLPSDQEAPSEESEEDEFEEENESSGSGKDIAEPAQRTLRSRKSAASSFPPALINFQDMKKPTVKRTPGVGGRRKGHMKRNSLHNWVYNQRRLQYEGNLPLHRKKLLDKIGFDWKWVQQRIDEQGETTTPKIEEEDELDVPSSKSEDLWHTRYRELIEFKQVHGHYEVPRYVE